ncbi:LysM peptidoglycan-binding domain-containing protein, partial [Candidatus Hamiltonella defensa]|nr:LysM peptidoglycan-binding domain-containing protein [Candidatus Hamiltonella defensa]
MLISFAFLILFFILLQTLMHSPQKKMESRVSHIPSTSSLPQDTDFIDQSDQSKFDETPEDELNDQEIHANNVQEHVIASGDTLGTVLAQYGIDISDIALLSANNPALRHLKTGQEISWKINGDGNLEQLTWRVSRSETRIYDRLDHHFKETQILQKGEWRSSLLNGHLDGNFINSAKKAGLNASEIHAVVKALPVSYTHL